MLSNVSVVLLTANLMVIVFAKQLLLNNQLQDQYLVPLVEHPVKSPPKAYLEPNHISKLTTESIFAKELHFRCLTGV